MRRWLTPLLLALTASALTVLPAPVATADENTFVEFSWPDTNLSLGQDARVTATGTDLTAPVTLTLRYTDIDTYEPGPLIATATITPASPVATITIPTDRRGTFDYNIEASEGPRDDQWITGDYWSTRIAGHPSTISATFPTGTYKAGTKTSATGTVSGTPGRPVHIQTRGTNGTWVSVAEAKSTASGTFTVPTATWWVATQTMRAYAPATNTYEAAATTNTATIKVTRTWTPRGGTEAKYVGGSTVRWNPCTVITYRVNPNRLPRTGLADLRRGFTMISEATGLRFQYVGTTTFVPYKRGQSTMAHPDTADIAIGWATPTQVPGLRGGTAGLGGSSRSGALRYDGAAVFDATESLGRTATARRRNTQSLILHELGHVIGLDHSRDKRNIMTSGSFPSRSEYGSGDLRGLTTLGATKGCVR